jgi:protein-S-isoprenylcysteine O-methyltransferase Ste14
MANDQSANARRAAIWVVILGLLLYRVSHMTAEWRNHVRAIYVAYWPLWVSAIIWALFAIYWEIAAKNAAPEARAESGMSRMLHVSMVNVGMLLLFVPMPGLTGRWLPTTPLLVTLGLAIELCGLLLAIQARHYLGRNWSGRVTIKVDHELIRSGPYRFMRHPIYTALLSMYAGTAVVSGEFHALIGFTFAAFAYWRKLRIEEETLADAFGAEWIEYRRSTRALLPGLF